MKKTGLILVAALLLALPFFAFTGTALATNVRSGANAVVKKGEVIDRTLFITGNNVEVNGEIKGDLFCAGQTVTVNAKVSGDIICGGMTLNIGGTVEGDVRLAGQTVQLSANVIGSASVAGNTVTIDEMSIIGMDAQLGANAVTLNGKVARDLHVGGSAVTINGVVGRNIEAGAESLTIGEAGNIAGNVTYVSNNKIQKAESAQITGTVTHKQPQQHPQADPVKDSIANGAFLLLWLLVLAMALAALLPRMLHKLSDNAVEKPGSTLLIGLAACFLMPVLIVGSFLTGIGALLGITLFLFWLLVMLLSGSLFSYYLGRLLLGKSTKHPLLLMFVGVLVYAVLLLVPLINVITVLAGILFGSGMLVRELLARTPKPVYETATPTAESVKAKKK